MASRWYDELRAEYERAHAEGRAGSPEPPDGLYVAARESLGDTNVDALHRVYDAEGELRFLVAVGEEAILMRSTERGGEILFLGALAKGVYTEAFELNDEGGAELELVFKHRRLPGGLVRAVLSIPSREAHVPRWERAAFQRTEKLRAVFRRWAGTGVAEPRPLFKEYE